MRLETYLLEEFGPEVTYIDFPELRQSKFFDCGPTSLQAVLFYYGDDITSDEIVKALNYEGNTDGANISDLIKVAEFYGINVESKEDMNIIDLKNAIDKKWPVIIELQAYPDDDDLNWRDSNEWGHYVVVIGYDNDNIYFEDPLSIKRTFLSYKELLRRWHGYGESDKVFTNWGMICKGIPVFKSNDIEHLG